MAETVKARIGFVSGGRRSCRITAASYPWFQAR